MRHGRSGIHTRLNFIIKVAGGIDKKARCKYLQATYGVSEEDAKVICTYPVEQLIEYMSIEEVVETIKSDEAKKIKKLESTLYQMTASMRGALL